MTCGDNVDRLVLSVIQREREASPHGGERSHLEGATILGATFSANQVFTCLVGANMCCIDQVLIEFLGRTREIFG